MAEQLKPGGLGAADATGIPSEFQGSMAKAIEDALNELLAAEGRPTVLTDNSPETRERRTFFVAIARGVVRHLRDNPEAFVHTVTGASGIDVDLSQIRVV